MVVLSTAFCPPIEYFAVLAGYSSVFIDSGENYQKQSWRNRCCILTADGPQDWMVPVVHSSGRAITQIEVEYTTPWVVKFERAVASAYDSSPFFEFYRDEFFAILDSHPATLWELNSRITEWICRKIGIALPEGTPSEGRATRGTEAGGPPRSGGGVSPEDELPKGEAPDGSSPKSAMRSPSSSSQAFRRQPTSPIAAPSLRAASVIPASRPILRISVFIGRRLSVNLLFTQELHAAVD